VAARDPPPGRRDRDAERPPSEAERHARRPRRQRRSHERPNSRTPGRGGAEPIRPARLAHPSDRHRSADWPPQQLRAFPHRPDRDRERRQHGDRGLERTARRHRPAMALSAGIPEARRSPRRQQREIPDRHARRAREGRRSDHALAPCAGWRFREGFNRRRIRRRRAQRGDREGSGGRGRSRRGPRYARARRPAPRGLRHCDRPHPGSAARQTLLLLRRPENRRIRRGSGLFRQGLRRGRGPPRPRDERQRAGLQ